MDSNNNPYILYYPIYGNKGIQAGDRIMIIYCGSGDYIPVTLNNQTANMITTKIPPYFSSIDVDSCIFLPHPNAIMMDQNACLMESYERNNLREKGSNWRGIRSLHLVAKVLISFLIFLLLAMCFVILVGNGMIETVKSACLTVAVMILLWILFSYGLIRFLASKFSKRFDQINYKKKVLFYSITTTISYGTPSKEINVFEYENGVIKNNSYSVNQNVFLPKNLRFGVVINKYSTNENNNRNDVNYFDI